jgi:hypothetical protein
MPGFLRGIPPRYAVSGRIFAPVIEKDAREDHADAAERNSPTESEDTPMDPTATMAEQLDLASSIISDHERGRPVSEHDAVRLAELVLALDEWLRRGGFHPVTGATQA